MTQFQKRYLVNDISKDLQKKMVFVGGPRQVGKTTMAFSLLKNGDEDHPAYLNWDYAENRKRMLNYELPDERERLIVFDEIHKYNGWRNLLKGFFDKHKRKRSFLITGSARLDYYRRGGDSLQGRYHYYRLHPFSLKELNNKANVDDMKCLLKFGGFPEPLFSSNEREWKRWQRERSSRIINDDLVNLEKVREISQLSLLASILPHKAASILSINSLREDLRVAFETAESWVQILENLYYCFRISPYGGGNTCKLRLAQKEKKLYLWDWSLCHENQGVLFENFVASHLLKYCHYLEDTEGDEMELLFLRDADKREVDFVVTKNKKPIFAIECKNSENNISPNIKYFSERTNIPVFYQLHMGKSNYENSDYRCKVMPFLKFALEELI
ncbi:MAG: ATP-binding protein [Oligoflexia bacterium]|nr:ATP-binding protein [Oligoflexia bacterium]